MHRLPGQLGPFDAHEGRGEEGMRERERKREKERERERKRKREKEGGRHKRGRTGQRQIPLVQFFGSSRPCKISAEKERRQGRKRDNTQKESQSLAIIFCRKEFSQGFLRGGKDTFRGIKFAAVFSPASESRNRNLP